MGGDAGAILLASPAQVFGQQFRWGAQRLPVYSPPRHAKEPTAVHYRPGDTKWRSTSHTARYISVAIAARTPRLVMTRVMLKMFWP